MFATVAGLIVGQKGASTNIPANTYIGAACGSGTCSGATCVAFSANATSTASSTAWAATQQVTSGSKPINGTDGFRIDRDTASGYFGAQFGVGDVNHDGNTDLIMGEYAAGHERKATSGSVYVLYGDYLRTITSPTKTASVMCTGTGCGPPAGFD